MRASDAANLVVTNTSDGGAGSLRQAILDANDAIGHPGLDTITFNIPGAGVHTIAPATPLPNITGPVVIDGYTQPGASANTLAVGDDAVILIEISGPGGPTAGISGLVLNTGSSGSTIRGLIINGFPNNLAASGIVIGSSGNNTIEGCFLGTNAAGSAAHGNSKGISVNFGPGGNHIGGSSPAQRNVISGNGFGISLGTATANVIQGNYIGVDKTGTVKIGNGTGIGLGSTGATNTQIGGSAAGAGNVVSGSTNNGIELQAPGSVVEGNFIGTDATGTIAIGNRIGVSVINQNNQTIGGPSAASRNLISGNTLYGISINAADNCVIQSNYIGTDISGMAALGNASAGIYFVNGTQNTIIGGLTATPGTPPGNLISGQTSGYGISSGGGAAGANHSNGSVLEGNLIGAKANGTNALGNKVGIRLGEEGVTVGGADPQARNVICASNGTTGGGSITDAGIVVFVNNDVIMGNYIGTDISGANPLGNANYGIFVNGNTNVIEKNLVAFSGSNGVQVQTGTGNRISMNSIHHNGKLGIGLLKPGEQPTVPTANDAADADTGPNNLQNFPILNSLTNGGGMTTVGFLLDSKVNTNYRIEFFTNDALDPSDYGEGQTFVGSTVAAIGATTPASFSAMIPQVPAGKYLTATATEIATNNTSEFSPPIPHTQTDFNGDSFNDFVLVRSATRTTVIWNLHGNVFSGGAFGPTLPAGWSLVAVGDLNSDNHPDYVLFNSNTRQTSVWFLNNAAFTGSALGPVIPSGYSLVAVSDINRDGKPDFVLFNPATRQTQVLFLNGLTVTSSAAGPVLPAGWVLIDAIDFGGDGRPDFVLFSPSTRRTAIWNLNGTTLINAVVGPVLPAGWTVKGAADFNANGKPDFVLLYPTTGQTFFWYLNGAAFVSSAPGPRLPTGYALVSP
jgi:hypothetical protein